nr:hypothetical protein [Tanacetum cinerariifolium]
MAVVVVAAMVEFGGGVEWRLRWWRGGEGSRLWVGVMKEGRHVVESGVWDQIDRVTGNIFGFAENARRKSFSAAEVVAGGGGGWSAVGR